MTKLIGTLVGLVTTGLVAENMLRGLDGCLPDMLVGIQVMQHEAMQPYNSGVTYRPANDIRGILKEYARDGVEVTMIVTRRGDQRAVFTLHKLGLGWRIECMPVVL